LAQAKEIGAETHNSSMYSAGAEPAAKVGLVRGPELAFIRAAHERLRPALSADRMFQPNRYSRR
jgi:hypothetical protein